MSTTNINICRQCKHLFLANVDYSAGKPKEQQKWLRAICGGWIHHEDIGWYNVKEQTYTNTTAFKRPNDCPFELEHTIGGIFYKKEGADEFLQ